MSVKGLAELRRLFTERYDVLKAHLTRRLGSSELASDALHDAYVRLTDRADLDLDQVRHPQSYVLNTAVNGAIDRLRSEARLLNSDEIDVLLDFADPAPGPAQQVQAQFDLEYAVQALDALPPRQRDILYSARVEGLTLVELSKRWGISTRMVSRELQAAHEFCAEHMKR
ncbi:sigma-24 [Pusillimonas sp. T7-7]|uniref:RNA polymerase sigma factor n=1 Tax=Pusillimonas sp. (strain T7-7) TaxID=1007105 RepID=UPI0002084AF7|nr:sigma-70 family RNA polymerase sigma factor [Pusillimonas sp. T7-7]AEC18819.1 sigma-24 [Pusillimonas sp. T7-7]